MKKFKLIILFSFVLISIYFINSYYKYHELYEKNLILKTQKVVSVSSALRGNIYDKNGILLVGNKMIYNLCYHYNKNENNIELISKLFNIDKDYILKKINNSYKYEDVIIKENISIKDMDLLISKDIHDFFIKEGYERYYPFKDTLKNILGSVGNIQKENKDIYLKNGYEIYEKVGISGLEKEYENYLKGEKAKYKIENNNLKLISKEKKGSDLYLSIDINLVKEIDNILKEELIKAKKHLNTEYLTDSYVILAQPDTGQILSINGQRYLNDNSFVDISLNNINNSFTMGSAVKGATISVGYKYNLIEKGKKILDGCVKLKNINPKCSFKKLGYLDDVSALKMSSNYYQFLIAIKLLGKDYKKDMVLNADKNAFDIYRNMLSSYGLGYLTGIDLPNEKNGIIGNKVADDLLLNLSIGQYDTYTPVQLINYINTLATKGKKISPSLVSTIKSGSDVIYQNKFKTILNVDIKEDDFDQIIKGFYEVMHSGTGLGFMNKKVNGAGKTGTSQSFIDLDNDNKVDDSSLTLTMVGFFPYDNPQISMIVVSPNASHNNGKNKDYIYYITSKISKRITDLFI